MARLGWRILARWHRLDHAALALAQGLGSGDEAAAEPSRPRHTAGERTPADRQGEPEIACLMG